MIDAWILERTLNKIREMNSASTVKIKYDLVGEYGIMCQIYSNHNWLDITKDELIEGCLKYCPTEYYEIIDILK